MLAMYTVDRSDQIICLHMLRVTQRVSDLVSIYEFSNFFSPLRIRNSSNLSYENELII